MSSLGARISWGMILSTAVVVGIAAAGTWIAARSILYVSLDAKLHDRARAFATRGIPSGFLAPFPRPREGAPPDQPWGGIVMQVLRIDTSEELSRSPGLPKGVSLATQLPADDLAQIPRSIRLPDGRPLRVMSLAAAVRPGSGYRGRDHHEPEPTEPRPAIVPGPVRVLLGADASAIGDDLHRLGLVLFALWSGSVVLASLVSVWLRRAILRPVDRLSHAIVGMDGANLSARLAVDGAPRELAVVLSRLNTLFDQVEGAFRREKSTIANIAHELRTPVAGLRTTLEFALARDQHEASRRVQEQCLGVVVQMQQLIANLLTLARIESGGERWSAQPIDINDLMRSCWDALEPQAAARGTRVTWSIPAGTVVMSAPDQLRTVVANLLDNAIAHAPHGAEVEVSAAAADGELSIDIANPSTAEIPDAAVVFQPFWRGDDARTGGVHCGLGLTLVQRLVHVLGGTVLASTAVPGRFAIRLTLPVDPAPLVVTSPSSP